MPNDEDGKEVLGNLPRHRPSIESPRRARARTAADQASAAPSHGTEVETEHSELAQLEQVARTGVRLAAGAAATGLKLAGRTVSGVGRLVGRR